MKRIKLTNFELYALVDDDKYEHLKQFKWRLSKRGYVVRSVWLKGTGKGTVVTMHREIMNTPKGMDTDHKDENRLNNQVGNLRTATRSQNMANVRKYKSANAHSKYKGVSYLKRVKKWVAYIRKDYKQTHLGYYTNQKDAARAYDRAARDMFGEFANLNFPE